MWLIVLDRSGSMAEPLSRVEPEAVKGRVPLWEEPSKWAAAAHFVRDEVASLAVESRMNVF